MARRSGILLPVASLPSPYGIGDFGPSTFRVVDWISRAGQRVWEVLPLLLPDEHGSPYASPSAFALNWMLVSPDILVRQKLLTRAEAKRFRRARFQIEYGKTNVEKREMIGLAWLTFRTRAPRQERERLRRFQRTERWWLDDYATFMALKDRHGGRPWWRWPPALRDRKQRALRVWQQTHREEIAYFRFGQWLAHEQWRSLKSYANKKGVHILGDLPFFIPHDSVDVWLQPSRVLLDRKKRPRWVSGAPPDYFQAEGQIWGDPLYRWPAMARNGFRWWLNRTRKALDDYDEIRLDHFRGYHAVWAIPFPAASARTGRWLLTPGKQLLKRIRTRWPRAPFVAEDLGNITPEVLALRNQFFLPGMRIFQFGFHHAVMREHRPDRYPVRSVAYSGTHDMPTITEWYARAKPEERAALNQRFGASPKGLLDHLLASRSQTVIMQIADVLGLGAEARINRPGIVDSRNWTWKLRKGVLNTQKAKTLRVATRRAKRA